MPRCGGLRGPGPLLLQLFASLTLHGQAQQLPAFVISGIDERWQHVSGVLQAVGFARPQRFAPVEASRTNADAESLPEAYDAIINTTSKVVQRELALRATFYRLFHTIAKLSSLGEDDFACLFEDDIAVHPSLNHTSLASILDFGSSLARKEGLLYLGSCAPRCDDHFTRVHEEVEYAKCSCSCTHAFAVTRRRARSLAVDLHSNMVEHRIVGHTIDDLLKYYSLFKSLSWVAGTNLVSPEAEGHKGVFFQNRLRFKSLINQR